jgi:hypothetical protein
MNEKMNNQHEIVNTNNEDQEETTKKTNNKPNKPKNQSNNIISNVNGSQSKLNSVVVSVKKFVENDNDLDEVTVSVILM